VIILGKYSASNYEVTNMVVILKLKDNIDFTRIKNICQYGLNYKNRSIEKLIWEILTDLLN